MYIIDGYNLLFRVARGGEDLLEERTKIIQDLNLKMGFLNLRGILVFDAQHQAGALERTHGNPLEIVYTAQGQTADECILDLVKNHPQPALIIVVTSDKKLSWLVRRANASVESVEHFQALIKKRLHNKIRREGSARKKKELPSPLPQKKAKPSLQALPEECFDYYLESFEKEIPRPSSKKAPPPQKKEKPLSDYERWLRAFEPEDPSAPSSLK